MMWPFYRLSFWAITICMIYTSLETRASCPVDRCECTNITLEVSSTHALLLNCSGHRIPGARHYLPFNRNHYYSLQRMQPYFKQFNGSYEEIKALDLSQNDIGVLQDMGLRNFSNLKSLDISQNYIRQIKVQSFVGLSSLHILNVSHNTISHIDKDAFMKLPKLYVLDLDDNRLYRLSTDWFNGLSSLRDLSVRENGLVGIDEQAFKSLVSLRTLSLANNALRLLPKKAFLSLDQLEMLDLTANQLNRVPSTILYATKVLRALILDSNPITELNEWSFQSLSITSLSMCNMLALTTIERNAFIDLPQLSDIQMINNRKFIYISPQAFHNLHALKVLNISNNALISVSSDIHKSLPNLSTLSLTGNPLLCDCNIAWLTDILRVSDNDSVTLVEGDIRNDKYLPHTDLSLQFPERLICARPNKFTGYSITNLTSHDLSSSCGPTIIESFSSNYQENVGSEVHLRCLAIGIPRPKIYWITPMHEIINGSSNLSRLQFRDPGSLVIPFIKPSDSGSYLCRAINKQGVAEKASSVRVHSNNIHLLQKAITSSFITLTWNGSQSTISTSDYLIMYRNSDSDGEFRSIPIHPYMRAYTFAQLKPQTLYEFCIAYDGPNHVPSQINCIKIRTKHKVYMISGIKSAHGAKVIITITIIAFAIAFLCVLSAACRNYKRRKDYDDPEFVDTEERGKRSKNLKHLSQIPLDTLHTTPSTSIPSTPLYASTTSLIPSSKA